MRLIALNVGNSRVTAALMDGHTATQKIAVAAREPAALTVLEERLRPLRAGDIPVAAASVNTPLLKDVERDLPFSLRVAGRDYPIPVKNLCRRPELTGHDRLLDCLAVGVLYGLPAIALDFGTALTFNVVDSEGAFLGGAIVPGLGLSSRSLASGCSQLPGVALSKDPPVLGRDTEEAIASGLLNGYVGLVDHMVGLLGEEVRSACRVVATGGEAHLIASRSKTIETLDPDLTLRGISLAFEKAFPE